MTRTRGGLSSPLPDREERGVAVKTSGLGEAVLVFALEAPDLLAGQFQSLRDGVLGDVLPAGVGDGAAEVEAGPPDKFAGVFLSLLVRLACGDYVSHWVRHPFIVSRVGLHQSWHTVNVAYRHTPHVALAYDGSEQLSDQGD